MNSLVLINKEMDMTSFDLVSLIRKQLNIRKVGHTGTLDPNATGLMVLVLNKATKLVNYLQYDDKEYIFELKLGVMTDTLDVWGKVVEEQTYDYPSEDRLKAVLASFIGKQKQMPPMYSALKVDGKRLYELARQNIEVERKLRDIEIFDIELIQYKPTIKVRVVVSSGTYIRSLCADIAERLGSIGVMSALKRTRVGQFSLDSANSIAEIKAGKIDFVSFETALANYPKVAYQNKSDIFNGRQIKLDTDEDLVVITIDNKSVAFYERSKDNIFKCKRGLW